jgi:hypothetical protein
VTITDLNNSLTTYTVINTRLIQDGHVMLVNLQIVRP